MMLPPGSMPEFAQQFRTLFPDLGTANKVLDARMSLLRKRPSLDVIALDDVLTAKHGAYPGSLEEAITQRYGSQAAAFVRRCL